MIFPFAILLVIFLKTSCFINQGQFGSHISKFSLNSNSEVEISPSNFKNRVKNNIDTALVVGSRFISASLLASYIQPITANAAETVTSDGTVTVLGSGGKNIFILVNPNTYT